MAAPQALLESGQVLLPPLLVAGVTLLTARLVVGGSPAASELIAFYGLTAFLTMPLRTATEGIIAATRGLVGARKVIAVLEVQPVDDRDGRPAAPPRRAARSSTRTRGSRPRPGASPRS